MDFSAFEILLLISFSILVYVYFGYFLLLMMGAKVLVHTFGDYQTQELPSVTLFIPAFNEEGVIAKKIDNALALDYPSHLLEIVVASDGSTDGTHAIVERYKQRGVKLFISEQNRGKNAALNQFVPRTCGEIIVFTDANAMFSEDALRCLVKHFADKNVGCVGGRLQYLKGETLVSRGEGLYFRYENRIREFEGALGRMIGANGAIYAIRRDLFTPVPLHVPNDFFHPLSVLKRGYDSVFERRALAREKPSADLKEEFSRRARIVTRGIGTLVEINKQYGLFKGKEWFYVISHKVLKWLVTPLLLTTFFANLFLLRFPLYQWSLALQIAFFSFAAIGHVLERVGISVKLFCIPYYFITANIAATVGIWNYLKGNRITTWQAASTTR